MSHYKLDLTCKLKVTHDGQLKVFSEDGKTFIVSLPKAVSSAAVNTVEELSRVRARLPK